MINLKFAFLFIFLASLNNILIAQKKGDNTIIVQGFVDYNKIKEVLFDNGFVSANSDTSFISTNSKAMGYLGEVTYIMKKTDSTLTIKGFVEATLDGFSTGKDPLENKGEKGTVYRVGFATMSKIANSFGLPVSYLKIKQ